MTRRAEIERLARFMGWRMSSLDNGVVHDDKNNIVRDPFTRLDDAMMVAEKITEKNQDFVLHRHPSDGCWFAKFEFCGVIQHGDTPAEAITLAALAYLSAAEGK